ncbi:retinol dehydrogenase [Geomonas limicola]|uniref:Retinol dehydrogenase n=1 Tax=Geomonas limicola TaxID=2740186 RepID=A0A6V8NAM7_9BACT|nr:SDR family oxidoreductase [Geomonas limicola]GFO69672.1 retinol dehydrogenase [Geomonas limicola]
MFHSEPDSQLAGRICLVTGATSGVGRATALALARRGATVVLAARNPLKARATVARLRRQSGNGCVEALVADLSVQQEIHRMVREFRERYGRLDVLVNNAGARFLQRYLSADGIEMTFALNHLGYFILTNLLLKELLTGMPGRVVNVASEAHRLCAGIDFEDLQGEMNYEGKAAYAQSKLANLLFSYELARQLDGTGVVVNAVHPGNVMSGFSRNSGWLSWLCHVVGSLRAGELRLPGQAAQGTVYLAGAPEAARVSGKYFIDTVQHPSSEASYDGVAARRLWEVSLRLARFAEG